MVRTRTQLRRSAAFTLTELLVAVVVLLVVILAVGRIFGTASQVVKNGEANSALLQEISAFEHQMRADIGRISGEGFLVINCLAVRNDVNGDGAPLLDPRQGAGVWLRCDQVAFLTDKVAVSSQPASFESFNEIPSDTDMGWDNRQEERVVNYNDMGEPPVPQSTLTRVYYGHGLQFPYLSSTLGSRIDPVNYNGQLQPWFRPVVTDGSTRIAVREWPGGSPGNEIYNGGQPAATDWALARQEILVADDGEIGTGGAGNEGYFLSSPNMSGDRGRNSAAGLFDEDVASSRVSVVASDLGRISDDLRASPRGLADELFFFRPRAEKIPLTRDRSDVMTTLSTLSGNCSSFMVDWTWADGTGAQSNLGPLFSGAGHGGRLRPPIRNSNGSGGETPNSGNYVQELAQPTPWFGLDLGPAQGNPGDLRNVFSATEVLNAGGIFTQKAVRFRPPVGYDSTDPALNVLGNTIPFGANLSRLRGASPVPSAIRNVEGGVPVVEDLDLDSYWDDNNRILRYSVVFSLNGDNPYISDGNGRPLTFNGDWPIFRDDYTPWPSALRVSMVLHDSKEVIEGGRTVQFTIPLPRSVQDLPE
ncbi:MAG: prepilin-type N-terminal cleavage/methylation domain-containing protein [Phycisphaerales bacterium]|nr:prepilin-type N-terminal cleavage/methylation domain-containing protein [Phycisphaerales bacterium]